MRGDGGVAALGVGCADDDAAHLGPRYRSGAHEARLYCDVKGAAGEIFAAEGLGGGGEGLHLGVGGHVGKRLGEVVAAAHDGAARPYDNGSDGHFARVGSLARLLEGGAHESFVICHHDCVRRGVSGR